MLYLSQVLCKRDKKKLQCIILHAKHIMKASWVMQEFIFPRSWKQFEMYEQMTHKRMPTCLVLFSKY